MISRLDILEGITARNVPHSTEVLKKSKVAIAGLGGLGSNIAVMLARIGVGHLFLVDFDVVEPSNLNRQHYNTTHIGMRKTEALKSQLELINPFVRIETMNVKINEKKADNELNGRQEDKELKFAADFALLPKVIN